MEAKRHRASIRLSRRRMAVVLRNSSAVSGSSGCRTVVEFSVVASPGDRSNSILFRASPEPVESAMGLYTIPSHDKCSRARERRSTPPVTAPTKRCKDTLPTSLPNPRSAQITAAPRPPIPSQNRRNQHASPRNPLLQHPRLRLQYRYKIRVTKSSERRNNAARGGWLAWRLRHYPLSRGSPVPGGCTGVALRGLRKNAGFAYHDHSISTTPRSKAAMPMNRGVPMPRTAPVYASLGLERLMMDWTKTQVSM